MIVILLASLTAMESMSQRSRLRGESGQKTTLSEWGKVTMSGSIQAVI